MTVLFDSISKKALPAFGVLTIMMMMYYAIYSKSGFIACHSLRDRVQTAQVGLDFIRAVRVQKEHEVALLNSQNLDLDLLEEQARLQFNMRTKDEEVLVAE